LGSLPIEAGAVGRVPGWFSDGLSIEEARRNTREAIHQRLSWATDYGLLSSNHCRLYLAPQGITVLQRDTAAVAQRGGTSRYAFTGSFGGTSCNPGH